MDQPKREAINLHRIGATVPHEGPFSTLEVPICSQVPNKAYIAQWIGPFYRVDLSSNVDDFSRAYASLRNAVTNSLISELLTFYDWRPRIVGAYFAAIENATVHCEHIGRLLLRSDLAYAGAGYALALARFNSDSARSYLCQYLDYYLEQPSLWFDQDQVMGAIAYLDAENSHDQLQKFVNSWNRFARDKPNWDLDRIVKRFTANMIAIKTIAARA